MTACPYFDNLKFDNFDAMVHTSVPCTGRFPRVHWHLGAKLISTPIVLLALKWFLTKSVVPLALNLLVKSQGVIGGARHIISGRIQTLSVG